jgi:hypothetical protein
MNWKLMFKGDNIAATEMGNKQPTLTIKGAKPCTMENDKGSEVTKPLVSFKEIDRGWVLCKTNALCLAAMFGDETTAWTGKRVTLHAVEVQVGKKRELGIRILGSPDIKTPIPVEIKLPRRRPFVMRMAITGAAAAQPAEATPHEEEPPDDVPPTPLEPIQDPATGEAW